MVIIVCKFFTGFVISLLIFIKTRNPEPGTRNPEPGTRNPEPGTRNPEPGTRNPEHGTLNQMQFV
jgi:hypothetical protein